MASPYFAKPRLKTCDRHVPPNLEYPDKTCLAYFREAVESVPRKVAVYYWEGEPPLTSWTGFPINLPGFSSAPACSPVTAALPLYGMKKAGSVGIPFPDTEVKLIHPDTGEPVPTGEPGEFVGRGPRVFTLGYHNNPEETAKTLKGGWIYTGDICKMDANGYFFVVDRLKDIVDVSGFNVFTRQVDEVLMEHPDIDTAATIGLPDPERPGSEIVASAVVLRSGIEKSHQMKNDITQFMRAKVAPYKIPRLIEFVDELPTSPVGKVLKRELRKEMQAE